VWGRLTGHGTGASYDWKLLIDHIFIPLITFQSVLPGGYAVWR
jgi:hypothetical protein